MEEGGWLTACTPRAGAAGWRRARARLSGGAARMYRHVARRGVVVNSGRWREPSARLYERVYNSLEHPAPHPWATNVAAEGCLCVAERGAALSSSQTQLASSIRTRVACRLDAVMIPPTTKIARAAADSSQ